MRLPRSIARQAFTLLEMLLALALGMVLLAALYLFLDMHVLNTQTGRDVLAEGTIARNIAARISADINGQAGPLDTRVADYSGVTTTKAQDGTTTTTPNPLPIVTYNTGIYGQPTYIVLSSHRVQKPASNDPTQPDLEANSDLRRTYYWLVSNGADSVGLARMEMKQATSMDADTVDPTTFPEQNKYVFAPEVKNIVFEFYDGTTWQTTWDGTTTVDSTAPPNGSPRAIRMTITLKSTLSQAIPAGDASPDGPTYQQIVAIPTTNSFTPKLAGQ